jgi:SnoaL-like domain
MGMISTVDVQTRLDICELLNRYCHYVDHDQGEAWAELFTLDGVFEVEQVMKLAGRDQLKTMPGIVSQQGAGLWRHQINTVMIDHSGSLKEKIVTAYGSVSDWGHGGRPVSFCDYRIVLRNTCRWQIAHLSAKMIGIEQALAA